MKGHLRERSVFSTPTRFAPKAHSDSAVAGSALNPRACGTRFPKIRKSDS